MQENFPEIMARLNNELPPILNDQPLTAIAKKRKKRALREESQSDED